MEMVFINKLKPLLDAVAEKKLLYVPGGDAEHYTFARYDPSGSPDPEFNSIRVCSPVKEFVFPMCEIAAVFPKSVSVLDPEPFAVFGLKNCDLKALEILDCVFKEEEFNDPFYSSRRENMFIISSDCSDPAATCCCSMVDVEPFSKSGFDLNLSKIKDGFIVEIGSDKGGEFVKQHKKLFADVPAAGVSERDKNRAQTQKKLEEINSEFELSIPVSEIMENSTGSDVFDIEAKNCVECQACTRICPTCHCFYLYDTRQEDYFSKMKMWDSCMRRDYATVAGGENPRKILGDRLRHRLMHKYVYFMERYDLDMCVGCGRCIDTDIGGIDFRMVLKKLNEEIKGKKQANIAK